MRTKTREAKTLLLLLISGLQVANQKHKLFRLRRSTEKVRHPLGTDRDKRMMSNETPHFFLAVSCRIACNTSAIFAVLQQFRCFSLWWCVLATVLLLIGFHCRLGFGDRSLGLDGLD